VAYHPEYAPSLLTNSMPVTGGLIQRQVYPRKAEMVRDETNVESMMDGSFVFLPSMHDYQF
jgi:hypothetical protein